MKLFDKNMPKRCEYCRHSEVLPGREDMLCLYAGVTMPEESCRHFVYDPLRRVPEPPQTYTAQDHSEEEFRL